MIAKGFAAEVERGGGAEFGGSRNVKTQLVDAKLEMVRANWLLQLVGRVLRFRWLDCVDRVQRDEIDRRLQRSSGSSQSKLCRDRRAWLAHHGGISRFRKHQR
jgi:hypothetical protein